jgi:hypothetical protein
MDIKPQSSQPISDDQELAKVLAGVNNDTEVDASNNGQAMSNIVPPVAAGMMPVAPLTPADGSTTLPDGTTVPAPMAGDSIAEQQPVAYEALPDPVTMTAMPPAPAAASELDGIKQEALGELRPLVDKLNLEPVEKFDTYLLLIRSTDDKTLVGPAHEAARSIPDETKRAEALLDIIKEIDFLSQQQ